MSLEEIDGLFKSQDDRSLLSGKFITIKNWTE